MAKPPKASFANMHRDLKDSLKEDVKKLSKPSVPQIEHPPRGERADFLKITMTIPGELLAELRALGMKRKLAGQKDTDTSALVREALIEFLIRHKDG